MCLKSATQDSIQANKSPFYVAQTEILALFRCIKLFEQVK
ncbi:hypothetical protein GGI1_12023 [Acidithiobacillus sp. GGI-221]|nr:hypothetical protein GGI1_12023 [Acidithiobacillus sp. GGI-221]